MILYLARRMRRTEEIRQALAVPLGIPADRLMVLLRDLSGVQTTLASTAPVAWVECSELPEGGAASTRVEVTFVAEDGVKEPGEDCATALRRARALARRIGVVFLMANDQHPLAARRVTADGAVLRDLLDDYGLDDDRPSPVVCASEAGAAWEPEWIGAVSSNSVLDVEGLHHGVVEALEVDPTRLELWPYQGLHDRAGAVRYAVRHPWGRAWRPDDEDANRLLEGVLRFCRRSPSELRVTHFSGTRSANTVDGLRALHRIHVVSNRGVEVEYLWPD
jgi:hypothetical protein